MTTSENSMIDEMVPRRSSKKLKEISKILEELGEPGKEKEVNLFISIPFYGLSYSKNEEENSPSIFRELLRNEKQASENLPSPYQYKRTKPSLPSPLILEKKLELLKSLEVLTNYFNDPMERHIQYFRFKEGLRELRDSVDQQRWDFLRVVVACLDAATNTESKDLKIPQVEAFEKVVEKFEEDIDCQTANSMLSDLISAKLKPVPPLKNLELIED